MIRWITPLIGSSCHEDAPDADGVSRLDVRDLVDKVGNPRDRVAARIDAGVALLRAGRKLVVMCDYGISRSNAIVAGILARTESISLDDAVRRVIAATGEKAIRIEVLEAVRQALGEVSVSARTGGTRSFVVTGGAGFIGSRVVARLSAAHRVASPRRSDLDVIHDSIALDALVRATGADTVIHLASPRVYSTNAALGEALTMLKSVCDVCMARDAHLVFASGWEVFSGHRGAVLSDESLTLAPAGTYGETKALCETLIGLQGSRGLASTVIRGSPAYGQGGDRPKFLWNFIAKARRGEPIVTHRYADGFPTLDLVHADDLARAVVAAAEQRPGGTINIGSGRGITTADVAARIVSRLGSASRITHENVEGAAPQIVMDVRKAAEILGWRPEIMFDAGLETVLAETIPPVQ